MLDEAMTYSVKLDGMGALVDLTITEGGDQMPGETPVAPAE